mgnify:CR=1 FL=1
MWEQILVGVMVAAAVLALLRRWLQRWGLISAAPASRSACSSCSGCSAGRCGGAKGPR